MLPVVAEVEAELVTSGDPDRHSYLPALGRSAEYLYYLQYLNKYLLLLCSPEANTAAIRLLLGPGADLGRAFAVQSIGGTGPLRLGAEFLRYSISSWGHVDGNKVALF